MPKEHTTYELLNQIQLNLTPCKIAVTRILTDFQKGDMHLIIHGSIEDFLNKKPKLPFKENSQNPIATGKKKDKK